MIIWTEDAQGQWKKSKVLQFKHKVWKVSWSLTGNILAVAQGDNKVSLWKEACKSWHITRSSEAESSLFCVVVDGDWKCLTDSEEKPKEDGKDQKDQKS